MRTLWHTKPLVDDHGNPTPHNRHKWCCCGNHHGGAKSNKRHHGTAMRLSYRAGRLLSRARKGAA